MKTQYYTATSLDGFIASKDHSLQWLFDLGDPEEATFEAFFKNIGALAMGSHTFEWLMQNHVRPGTPEEQPWPYELPVWIFSSRKLSLPEGARINLVQGDVRIAHTEMVETTGEKNLWIVGGGELAGQFFDAALLDEIIVQVAPALLGEGMPLLPRKTRAAQMTLADSRPLGAGFVELRYDMSY